jgi:hypothetical protein
MAEPLDFELEIGPPAAAGYPVAARLERGAEATGVMGWSMAGREIDTQLATIRDSVLASSVTVRRLWTPDEQPVREFGQRLFDAFFRDDVRMLYGAAYQQSRQQDRPLRLVLRIRPPELARLPWEYLFDRTDDTYVGLRMSLIRRPQVLEPQRPLKVDTRLNILAMVARPADQAALDVRSEKGRLQTALADLQRTDKVKLTWVGGQSWRDLRTAVDSGPWHVFHFIGHGGFDTQSGEGALALAGEDGGTSPLGAAALSMVLSEHTSLRLVVLNACDTGRSSSLDSFSSVAGALVRRGIPAILAMQFEITDRAAIEFARTFYEQLAHRRPVDIATMRARQAIYIAQANSMEWGTPVLYLRSTDGQIFDSSEADSGDKLQLERHRDAVAIGKRVAEQPEPERVSFEGTQHEDKREPRPRPKMPPLAYLLWAILVIDTGVLIGSLFLVRVSSSFVVTALLGLAGAALLGLGIRGTKRSRNRRRVLSLGAVVTGLACSGLPLNVALHSHSVWWPMASPSPAPPPTYANTILKDKPLIYLQMEETSGTVAHDSSGSGHDGSYRGQVSLGAPGISGSGTDKAATLSGDSGYILLPTVAPLQHGHDRTVEFWFKTTQSDQRNILTTGQPSHASSFNIALLGPRGPEVEHCGSQRMAGLYVDFFDDDVHLPALHLADGNWHYVAVAVFAEGRRMRAIVDGEQSQGYVWNGSCFTPGVLSQPFQMPWPIETTPSPIEIGKSSRLAPDQGGGEHYPGLTGPVDEFALYPAALEPAQLIAHYRRISDRSAAHVGRPGP